MPDLATLIREYYDSAAEPVEATEILAGGRPDTPHDLRPEARWLRPLWAAAAAAIIVVVAIGVVALPRLLGGGDAADDTVPVPTTALSTTTVAPTTTDPSVTSTTTSTTSTTPVPNPEMDISAAQWAPLEETAALFEGSQVYGLAPRASGMLAVGSVWADGRPTAAVWTTSDGRVWSRVEGGSDVFGGGAFEMWAVASDGERVVAVGHGCDDPDNPCAMRPTAWTLSAGGSWRRIAHDPEVFGLGGQMTDVVFHDGRLIAVGVYCDDTDCYGAAWSSDDGAVWSRTWVGEPQTHPAALVAGDSFVAVGDALQAEGRIVAAAWTSQDGVEWTRASHDEAVFGGEGQEGFMEAVMTSIALSPAGDDSYVAGGWVIAGNQRPRIWTSPDGVTWQISADLPSTGIVSDITTYDEITVAVGTSIWRSDDGIAWRKITESANSNAVAVGTSGWVAISSLGQAWVSPPPG